MESEVNKKSPIIIDETCIFRVKIEDLKDLQKSFFREEYLTAFNILREIISETNKINFCDEKLQFDDSINNIIS